MTVSLQRQGHDDDSPQAFTIDPRRLKRNCFAQFAPWVPFLKRLTSAVGVYTWDMFTTPFFRFEQR